MIAELTGPPSRFAACFAPPPATAAQTFEPGVKVELSCVSFC